MHVNKSILIGVTVVILILIGFFNFKKGNFSGGITFLFLGILLGWSGIKFR